MPTNTDRRKFLVASAAAASFGLNAACGQNSSAKEQEPRLPLVDGHLHCFAGGDDARFPYHAQAPYKPAQAATPEHLLRCMDGAGVGFAIVVHPEPYQDDHRYLEHCLNVGRGRLKGTLLLFADRPGSVEKLPKLVESLDVVSARVHAYAPERLPPFGKPELRNYWKLASDHGLAIQLHFEPRYAEGFSPLIREFSKTPVIIDHLGRPFQGTPREHETVLQWAKQSNTYIKLSSLTPRSSYPHRNLQPIVRRLAAAYGAERMIYGGGFNAAATSKSYRAAFERGRSYISHLSAKEQAMALGGTAAKLFGFKK